MMVRETEEIGLDLSEGLKVAWFLDGLKAEDGSTVSISKSAMFSDSAYSEDLNKVIGRLTMDIAGNKANRRAANYNKHGGKKQKFNVSEVGVDDPSPPSKPSKKPLALMFLIQRSGSRKKISRSCHLSGGNTAHTSGMKPNRRRRINRRVRLLLMK